jgi:histidine ammonia-lyase
MWSPSTGLADASKVLKKHGLKPIVLKAKEGLALINGTQMITALGAEAIERAKYLAIQADIIAAMTTEVLKGNVNQFDSDIHSARPHPGQGEVNYELFYLIKLGPAAFHNKKGFNLSRIFFQLLPIIE